jgi:hypothetical protein
MGILVSELGKFSLIRGPGGRSELHGLGGIVKALTIKYEDPRKLRARPTNPRTHTPRQINRLQPASKSLASSIRF